MNRWLLLLAAGCASPPSEGGGYVEADFTVRPGVEVVSVLDAEPRVPLTLYDADGNRLITVITDDLGQAHFAYVPAEHLVLDSNDGLRFPVIDGTVLYAGTYTIRNDEVDPPESTWPFQVSSIDDLPDVSLYESQPLTGVKASILGGLVSGEDPEDGFQYIEVRDGTLLSVMVRFPDPLLYGDGPWPAVIEYSGYSPSRPSSPDAGSLLANTLGYVAIGVNMRGTGCSGGVFDVFNRAQHADGYDVIETIARQEWALEGRVGMLGLSYPGISQLYVASTAPPSLAAIVPLSTIADSWEMQWPGGVYNQGFTEQWIDQRESDATVGGTSWVSERIENGDAICAANKQLSRQNVDFEPFLSALEFRPPDADDRDLNQLVEQIEAPVFLGGQFQDEQTGALFGGMLDRFVSSPDVRFRLSNGRHPDGYGPLGIVDWWAFLELHLARRIPVVNPALEALGESEIAAAFDVDPIPLDWHRYDGYATWEEALAAWRAEPPVELLFESGAGGEQVGAPVPSFSVGLDAWPPPQRGERTWFADADGVLADAEGADGADAWRFDPDAGTDTFFGGGGYPLLDPVWNTDWTRFAEGDMASYLTEPLVEDQILTGPGLATLWVRSPEEDVTVQVTLTEVRPDGQEVLVQSGWLRLGHRAVESIGQDLRVRRSYAAGDFAPLPVGEWVEAVVSVPSFAHPFRAGSRLRMMVSTPGRNHGTWQFAAPAYDGVPVFDLGRGGDHPTTLTLSTLPGVSIPETYPPCPSLRGQPCRAYEAVANTPAD